AFDISPFTRGRVVGQSDCGHSERQIARSLGLANGTVHNIIVKYRQSNERAVNHRPGRPSMLTEGTKRALVRVVSANPRTKLVDIASTVNLSQRTAQRYLHKLGYNGSLSRPKPLLTKANVKRRLAWAQEMKEKPAAFWRSVVFTDQSQFQQFASSGRTWAWRKAGQAFQEDCVQPPAQDDGFSVMVWAAVWHAGKTELVFTEGPLDSPGYVSVLENHLLPLFRQGALQFSTHLLQEDCAPCHTSKTTTHWKSERGLQVVPWPPRSPDMNPIAHIWERLDRQLQQTTPRPPSAAALRDRLSELWRGLDQALVQTLIAGLQQRVLALHEARGRATRF
uniref:Transposase Tc1-like domain-containing protein n=1 Tax=Lepisosteus oculatus TaxID=7918 RepID=W5NNH8_LEPOC